VKGHEEDEAGRQDKSCPQLMVNMVSKKTTSSWKPTHFMSESPTQTVVEEKQW